jgi:hypothetical protein
VVLVGVVVVVGVPVVVVVAAGGVGAGGVPPVLTTVSVAVGAELASEGPPLLATVFAAGDPPDAKGDGPMNWVPAVPDPAPAVDALPPDGAGAGVAGGVWKSGALPEPAGGPALVSGWPFGPAPTVTTPPTTDSAAAATASEATMRLPAKYGLGVATAFAAMAAAADVPVRARPKVRDAKTSSRVALSSARARSGVDPSIDPPLGIAQGGGTADGTPGFNPRLRKTSYPLTATI